MTQSPQVSIVMSVYNDAERIERSIDSLLRQTFQDFELIVVNDGSRDDTAQRLSEIANRDSRLRVIEQQNTGLTKALIRGCAEARGIYIARQDSDDWSAPTRLEKQVAMLDANPDIGFVSCFTQYVGPEGEPLTVLKRPLDANEATDRLLLHREGPPAHGSVLLRKELYEQVGGYRPQFYFSQDTDLWLRMGEQAHITYVAEVLYSHRREMGSISGSQRSAQHEFGLLCLDAREARMRGDSEDTVLEKASKLRAEVLENQKSETTASLDVAYLLGSQLVKNRDARARGYLWTVLRRRPWHWRAWVRLAQSCWTGRNQMEFHNE